MSSYTDEYVKSLENQLEHLQEKLRNPEKMCCYWDDQTDVCRYFIGSKIVAWIRLPNTSPGAFIDSHEYIIYDICGVVTNINRISSLAEVKEIIENEFWRTGVKKYTYV